MRIAQLGLLVKQQSPLQEIDPQIRAEFHSSLQIANQLLTVSLLAFAHLLQFNLEHCLAFPVSIMVHLLVALRLLLHPFVNPILP